MPILAGSDAGNPATFHGISLVRELELLAQAGMPLADVLKAATSRAADRLGQSSLGRIAAGAVADLVVLEADPTEDVGAYRRVGRCILAAGSWISRDSPTLRRSRGVRTGSDADGNPAMPSDRSVQADASLAGRPTPG